MAYLLVFIVGGLLGAALMALANAAGKEVETVDARRQQRDERR